MSDVITVKGAKAGQDKARKPSIAKDSVASTSTAKLLYGLAEGEVYGLVDGGKSIRLDGTPLLDDNSSSNFDGVTWDFRHGTNEQEYIQGFPDVSNETGINVELKSSQPFIKAFTDTQLDAIRVRFKWNRLSKTDDEDGDVTGYKIDYAIDLQTDGGAYQNVLTTKIEDKTSAGYERTHRIDLPKANSGWQIRVRRITPNSDSEYIQDEMYIDAVAEVIDVKLAYPNTALLGIQYNAETFSSIAKIAVHMRGSIIRVPSNYNSVARTYTGIWDGTFKDAYSNNPAWVYYDLCMQWRYGLGDRLDATMIDKWSLYTLGQYCDERVSDGQGGTEPRYTCNVYLQKQADAYQVLQNIAGLFAALSYWNGEKIFVDADVPKDPVYTFSRANVIGGQFEYTGTRARDRHTIVKVAWDNPANNFETEYEYVRDDKAIAKFGVKVLDLAAFGCTSQGQAQRMGLRALKTEQLETRQVSFSVGLDGVNCGIGNIINVSDELFAGRANGGRVSTVNSTQRIIELDRDVLASVGDVLIINGGTGKSERRNISNVVGNRITVTAGFTSAEPEHVWAIETADLKLMRFRVMQITENSDDNTYNIVGIQHEPQKYDAIDFGTDVKPTNITIVNPQTVDAPSAVTITSRHRVVQSQTIATLIIGWSQVKDAVSYDVEWRKDDGSWIKIPRTGNVSVEIDGVYSGQYLARVRAISPFDVQSQPTTSLLTAIEGKVGLPPVILGLVATGVLFGIELKWGFGAGSGDSDYTEIQTGSAPDTNVALLGKFSYPTNSHVITGLQGNLSQSYRARLVDKLGNKSAWSAWATATTDASADKVLDLVQGKINESSLNTALTTKIAKIGTIETGLDNETQNRIDAIINLNKRTDDNFITDTDVEYYLSNSATTPTGGTWQTTAPAYQQSKFIFSRTKTTLGNGATSYSPSISGTNITGAKGDKGEQGVAGRDGINGIDGVNGIDGLEGPRGADGIAGAKGADGKSSYTHLAYGTSSTGAGFSTSHYPNATYIGMYVDNLPTDSNDPSKYKWSLIKGADGTNGVAGQKGADGLTPYFHVAYANSIDGTVGFSTTVSVNKTHIGQYTDNTQADSTTPSKYKWTLIKGADGAKGIDGVNGVDGLEGAKGDQGIQGVKGADGISSYTHLAYGTSASGAGFSKFHFTNATYIGLYVDNIAADSDTPSKYNWSLIKGADGANGIAGAKGADGLTPYLHIAYATNADGTSGFSTTVSAGKTYIGQYTDNTQADSTTSSKYKWTLIKGATGNIGQGVSSIEEQYAISASKTVAPSTWSTAPPIWTKGLYVWTRSKITYKDPASIQYTTPVVGAEWDAITQTKTDFINFEEDITDELGTQGETLNGIIADYQPEYFDKTKYFSSQAQQWTYAKTVARDNYAESQRITNLQADFADSNATVRQELETLATADAAIATSFTQLKAETDDNSALIQDLSIAITTPETGLSAKVTELQSKTGNIENSLEPANLATLVEGSGAFTTEFDAISGQYTTMQGTVNGQTTSIEVASAVGDLNKLKNEIAKARIDKDVIKLQAQSDALTSAIDNYTSKINEITALRNASSDNALRAEYAKQIAALNTAKDDANTQKSAITAQVNQLNAEKAELESLVLTESEVKAQHYIKLDSGGRVSGYGLLQDDTGNVDFAVNADSFRISPPTGTGRGETTFVHYNTAQTINGVVVPVGTYLANAYIASLSGGKIHANSITADRLVAKTITAESGVIADLAVDTLQIADNAVTIPRVKRNTNMMTTGFPLQYYPSSSKGVFLLSASMDAKGGAATFTAYFDKIYRGTHDAAYSDVLEIRLYENDTLLKIWEYDFYNYNNLRENTAPFLYEPSAGLKTYSLYFRPKDTDERATIEITGTTLHIQGAAK